MTPDDFRYGESGNVPVAVSLPNRNYMNLLELPRLLYVACLIAYLATEPSVIVTGLAWAYVGTRVAHSVIHLTCNAVLHRLLVFALSNIVLLAPWVEVFLHLKR